MPPIFRRVVIANAIVSALGASQGVAQVPTGAFENIDGLEMRVVAALGANIGEPNGPARPVDRRLRLAPCPQPVTIDAPALGSVTVHCQPLGWRIRVPLTPGSTTPGQGQTAGASWGLAPAAAAQPIVHRGDQVQLVVLSSSFSVTSSGTAEQDGAAGARIRVRTDAHPPATLMGEVLPDGRVALPGFN